MIAQLRQIGNSQGIIIPRPMLQQVGIQQFMDIEVADGTIILRPLPNLPRQGWADAFAQAAQAGHVPEDDLFDGMDNSFDKLDWQW